MRPKAWALVALLAAFAALGSCGADDGSGPLRDPAASTSTTCVRAPATTAVGMRGGGEVLCGPVDHRTPPPPPTTVP